MRHPFPFRSLLCLIVFCFLLSACGGTAGTSSGATPTATKRTLNVLAAASLTESFTEIQTRYESLHPDTKIRYNFNGSQLLVQQLINGAQADVLATADQTTMKKATDAGLVGTARIFAQNKLAVIVPKANPGNITTLKDLAKKGKKIVVAAPSVPVGNYTLQVLAKLAGSSDYGKDYENAVKANIVSQEENVKAVVQKVQLGEADAGIVYRTDVTSTVADKIILISIPDSANVIAKYPIAVTKSSAYASEAQAFVQYILSADGQKILQKYRFTSVGAPDNKQ